MLFDLRMELLFCTGLPYNERVTKAHEEAKMSTVTIEEAQAKLPELIEGLTENEPLTITRDAKPIAQIVAAHAEKPHSVLGRGKGKLVIVSEDDEHLRDFEEYMP